MILAPAGHVPGVFPYGIGYAYGPGGAGTYLCPEDPMNNERGEAAFYTDTALGAAKPGFLERMKRRLQGKRNGLGSIPTDTELASRYGYTPVNSGWIASNQGYYTGPWIPPNGYRPAGAFGPPTSLNDAAPAAMPVATANDVIAVLNAHNDRMFTLTLITTVVGGLAATLAIVRTVRAIRNES